LDLSSILVSSRVERIKTQEKIAKLEEEMQEREYRLRTILESILAIHGKAKTQEK